NREMTNVTGAMKPCHRPWMKPATVPSAAAVLTTGFTPGAHAARTSTTSEMPTMLRVRLSNLMAKRYCNAQGEYIDRKQETEAAVRHYLLIYHLKDDYLERRPRFRSEHLGLAKEF